MKYRVFALLGVLAMSASTLIQAQDYDDIYYGSSSKSTKKTVKVKSTSNGLTTSVSPVASQGAVATSANSSSKYYSDEFDVDAYNRRGAEYEKTSNMFDRDSIIDDEETSTFSNTERIERFYNPEIIIKSNDDELVELYYDNASNVNIIIGTPSYSPVVVWNDFWYDSWWHDPFYWGWHRPYWYSSWSWGWHSPWYWDHYYWGHHHWGWHDTWHHGWGWHHGWNHHYTNYRPYSPARRPSSRIGNSYYGSSRVNGYDGSRRANSNGNIGTRTGTMTNGRTRPATSNGTMNTGRRPATVGNVGTVNSTRSNRDITTRSSSVISDRSSTGTMSRSSSSRSSSSATRSYEPTRSYNSGSSSSRSSSGWGGGGFSSGSSRGGGFSSGSSSRGGGGSFGGGGGGGRRH